MEQEKEERQEYARLRDRIQCRLKEKGKNNYFRENFGKILGDILGNYVRDDSNRAFRCGIIWLDIFHQTLAVNTHQLQKLIGRCRSSLNQGFREIGYDTEESISSAIKLIRIFPSTKTNRRKWSIKRKTSRGKGVESVAIFAETPHDTADFNSFDEAILKIYQRDS
jgi:hypothetical protein